MYHCAREEVLAQLVTEPEQVLGVASRRRRTGLELECDDPLSADVDQQVCFLSSALVARALVIITAAKSVSSSSR
jgi:hypothetical protein